MKKKMERKKMPKVVWRKRDGPHQKYIFVVKSMQYLKFFKWEKYKVDVFTLFTPLQHVDIIYFTLTLNIYKPFAYKPIHNSIIYTISMVSAFYWWYEFRDNGIRAKHFSRFVYTCYCMLLWAPSQPNYIILGGFFGVMRTMIKRVKWNSLQIFRSLPNIKYKIIWCSVSGI